MKFLDLKIILFLKYLFPSSIMIVDDGMRLLDIFKSSNPRRQSNEKMITKDYFGFLLNLIFHDYKGLVCDYN